MSVWLVTGGSGFLGGHLLAELRTRTPPGVSLLAVGRRCPAGWATEGFLEADLDDRGLVARILKIAQPSCVFHLAGKTPPGLPDEFDRANTAVTIGLLEALQSTGSPCRLVLVGSAAELGPVAVADLPVAENYPARPVEPYGRSKWLATRAALTAGPPLEVVVGRVFNPIGPGLPPSQALGRFASLLAEATGPVHLAVGDLDARRDFVDVRDIASGLFGLALRGRPGEVYHLGTGQSHAVREGLDRLIALSGREVTIEVDPNLARSRGPSDSRADIRKVVEEVGWSPRIAWEQSLADLWLAASEAALAGLTDPQPLV